MEKVYRFFGRIYRKSRRNFTHVLLTKEEYNELMVKMDSIINEKKILQNNLNNIIDEKKILQNNLNNIIDRKRIIEKNLNTLEISSEREQKKLKKYIIDAKSEKDRVNKLNTNLIRIMKERANSKRGIIPKKDHSGYLVKESTQYEKVYYYKNEIITLRCWKTKIQTPYDSTIPYEIVEKEIKNDMKKIFNNISVVSKLYSILPINSIDNIRVIWNSNENFIFENNFRYNLTEGFWEIEYLSKDNIVFPENMMKL